MCRGRDTRLIHLRSFPSRFGIYKRKLLINRRTPGFINLTKRMSVHISGFVHTHSFSHEFTQSFKHLAPGIIQLSLCQLLSYYHRVCAIATLKLFLQTAGVWCRVLDESSHVCIWRIIMLKNQLKLSVCLWSPTFLKSVKI